MRMYRLSIDLEKRRINIHFSETLQTKGMRLRRYINSLHKIATIIIFDALSCLMMK